MKGSAGKNKPALDDAYAVRCAYRLLSYRGRSEKELEERLARKGFAEEIIRRTISRLKKNGFINDESLAVSLKRIAEDTKKLGTHGTKLFLRQRGLSREIIDNATSGIDADEMGRAKKLVDRKLRTMGNYSNKEISMKLWRLLSRKGYSFDSIKQALKKLKIKEDEE